MENAHEIRWPSLTALAVSLVAFFVTTIAPIQSLDFWFHLKSGEYIVERGELPDTDFLSFSAPADDEQAPGRPEFVLKQYWLAQIIYAIVEERAGLAGVIVLRGFLFILVALTAWSIMRALRAERGALVTLPLLLLATQLAVTDGDRPQLYIFLSSLIVVASVEWAVRSQRVWPLFIVIPALGLASNMHGGYVVGFAYLGVYAACSWFEARLSRLRLPLLVAGALALGACYLNPLHWQSFSMALTMVSKPFASISQEYRSPFTIMQAMPTASAPWIAFWGLTAFSVVAIIYLVRQRSFSLALILLGPMAATFFQARYHYFFTPLAAAVTAKLLTETLFRKLRPRHLLESAILTALVLGIVVWQEHPNRLGIKKVTRNNYYPVKAADFLSGHDLPERVFNDINWGGYLEWRLWPRYRTFINTRGLVIRINDEYAQILGLTDRGRRLMQSYGIGTVVTHSINPYTGKVYPLVQALVEDPGWALVHQDGVALIFVRREYAPRELPKSAFYYHVLEESQRLKSGYPSARRSYEATEIWALEGLGLNPPGTR